MTESVIENAILQYLNTEGHFAVKLPDQRAYRDGKFRTHPFMPRGIPDILCMFQGRAIFFEVKTEKGRLSEHQKKMLKKINFYVVRSIKEVREILSILAYI